MVDKWLGCHSESVMSSSFPHFKLSEHEAPTAQCSLKCTFYISLYCWGKKRVKSLKRPMNSLCILWLILALCHYKKDQM